MRRFAPASFRSVSKSFFAAFALLLAKLLVLPAARAQSLGYEGPTGVFVTPLAYTFASPANGLGKPFVSYHFLAGGPVIGDFSTVFITEGFAKRFEADYTSEIHAGAAPYGLWLNDFSIVHGKAVLVPKNAAKTNWVPSIAIGGLYCFNDHNAYDGATALQTEST